MASDGSTAEQPATAGVAVHTERGGRTDEQPGVVGVVVQVAMDGSSAEQIGEEFGVLHIDKNSGSTAKQLGFDGFATHEARSEKTAEQP